MIMKHGIQKKIAKKSSISPAFLSEIINNKKRPSWTTAKRLAEVTSTPPELWLDGDTASIRAALSKSKINHKKPKENWFVNVLKKWGLYGNQ